MSKWQRVSFCRQKLTFAYKLKHHLHMDNQSEQILKLAKQRGLIRPRDLEREGLPRVALTRLVRSGQLERIGRGLYAFPGRSVSEHTALAEVASKDPKAIICLLSALRFHELTTQSPHQVWIAIPHKARPPRMDYPALKIVRFSGAALTEGIEEHTVDDVVVRITSVAKTVADCFKHRNKIGLDVALEALQEATHGRRGSMDDIWHFAAVCRVTNIIRPYMESLP